MFQPTTPLRVLCADDNAQVLSVLEATLRHAGYSVEVAPDGAAAAAKVKKDPAHFQLIITDTQMPRLDGFGLVTEARSSGYGGRLIVFVNNLSDEDRAHYHRLRVDRIIDKPGRAGEMIAAVRDIGASREVLESAVG